MTITQDVRDCAAKIEQATYDHIGASQDIIPFIAQLIQELVEKREKESKDLLIRSMKLIENMQGALGHYREDADKLHSDILGLVGQRRSEV